MEKGMKKHDILVVDDHAVVRQGLMTLINQEKDMRICAEAEDGPSALAQLAALKPDLAIVDITLGSASGLDLIKAMKARYPHMPILVFSMHEETIFAERMLRAGASGYVMKSEAPHMLVAAIRRLLEGRIFLSEKMTEQMLSQVVKKGRDPHDDIISSLSDREFEVFQLIGKGMVPRLIARRLNLSVKTIDSIRENMKHKLGLKSASELAQYAIEHTHDKNLGL
jgi:DNA-binding NarL/FixJ family response regulator